MCLSRTLIKLLTHISPAFFALGYEVILYFHFGYVLLFVVSVSYIILEDVRSCCSVCVSVGHKFYIQLALPISPEIMDRFWCSRCLNDRIKVPDMMRLFAGGATTPLVVKIWTKQPWVKIQKLCNFDCNFALSRGKIWLWQFYNFFCVMVPRFYTKKIKSFRAKMKAWLQFSRFLIF